jgi:outer membrane protein OmpA-like peptidoglycan-associated protein
MKRHIAATLLAASAMVMQASPRADACGVKLTVKSSGPRKAIARTSNPSDILVLGDPPRRLESDLSAAGHRVEVAPHASAAKRKSYAVVITDAPLQAEARSSFPDAVVVVRSDDTAADERTIEQQVARRPVRTGEDRAVVAAAARRAPIAAGPTQSPSRQVVAASPPSDVRHTPDVPPAPPAPPAPSPAPEHIATAPATRPVASRAPEVAPAVKPGTVRYEVYFSLGSGALSTEDARSLARAAHWLTESRDVQVIIEGHADPSGTPEGNLALGQKRAEWVRDYLVSAGIDAARLEVISYGDTRLKYGRTNPRNRRAAIVAK